jgi:serine/threonine protein kinase
MILEYVSGGDLSSYMSRLGKFSNEMAKYYAAHIVSTLEYLHEKNISHGNLRPEYILLDSRGKLKLVGFGFATSWW